MRILTTLVPCLGALAAMDTPPAIVRVTVGDDSSRPLAVRMHLRNAHGDVVEPPGVFFRRDYLVFRDAVTLRLAPGSYRYDIEHGPEYSAAVGEFEAYAGSPVQVRAHLTRIADLAAEGWWSGDLHIHRELEDIELLAEADDLHVAPVITWWNANSRWRDEPLPDNSLRTISSERFVHAMAGEDERAGGALLFFNLRAPLPIAGADREYPSPVVFARMAREHADAHIDIEKPFWWDVPTWLALGLADTIGLANNHMCRATMYESEAWGKPRDVERLPSPRGNGFWSQEIYYHVLNAGLRIPPSAGSAAGVLPNPIGYDRVYVYVDGALSYDAWWENLRAGHSFVTNGPLLRVTANGEAPGGVFSDTTTVTIEAHLTTRDRVPALEIVHNGVVVQTIAVNGHDQRLQFEFAPKEAGWFLVRAVADVPHTFRFAATAPFYVESPGRAPRISRASCRFFLDWVRERISGVAIDDPARREEVIAFHREAETFWSERLNAANAD